MGWREKISDITFGKWGVDDDKLRKAKNLMRMGRSVDEIVEELELNDAEKRIVFQWFQNI